uniref:PolB16 intein n=1 Tax=metagenome TaxID=256318 RepID=UPI0024AA0392
MKTEFSGDTDAVHGKTHVFIRSIKNGSHMQEAKIDIKSLYDSLAKKYDVQHKNSYEVIYPKGYEIKVLGNKYVKLVAMSRHKTQKHLVKIVVKSEKTIDSLDPIRQKSLLKKQDEVVVTTDHICMVYNDDHFFENVNAKNLKVGNYVSVYDEASDKEVIGEIASIEDLGMTDDYVYDCEVDDDSHAFYASNILVHASQFCNGTKLGG